MIRVLFYLALIALLALGAVWFAERPGEVAMVWQGYRIETSVAVAFIGVVALAFAVLLVWTALRFIFGLPTALGFASAARRRAKGFTALSRGLVAVGAGDPVSAQRYAGEARRLVADDPLTLLLEAQSAQMVGDRAGAETSFKAMLERSETRVLGLRGLFVEARRRGDQDSAQAFADEAVKISPSLAWANDALLEFHGARGDWAAARTAVERRAALKLADKNEARRQRAVLHAAEALAKRAEEPEAALSAALEAVKLAPGLVPAAVLAGELLVARGDVRKASRILEAAWKETAHPDLARVYVAARAADAPSDRLARAEALAKLRPADPESALTVASAAIAARDFARARAALAPMLTSPPTVRTCLLMAELEEAEHGAAGRVREWLARATRAPQDPAWIADGIVSQTWLPASPVTGALDAFSWQVPPVAYGAGPVLDDPLPEAGPMPTPAIEPPPLALSPPDPSRPAPQPEVVTVTQPVPMPAMAPTGHASPEVEAAVAPQPAAPAYRSTSLAPEPAAPQRQESTAGGHPASDAGTADAKAAETKAAETAADAVPLQPPLPDDPGPDAAPPPEPRRRFFGLFG